MRWRQRSEDTVTGGALGRGAYVALAEELNAPLLTRDVRLAQAKQHRARIETV